MSVVSQLIVNKVGSTAFESVAGTAFVIECSTALVSSLPGEALHGAASF